MRNEKTKEGEIQGPLSGKKTPVEMILPAVTVALVLHKFVE